VSSLAGTAAPPRDSAIRGRRLLRRLLRQRAMLAALAVVGPLFVVGADAGRLAPHHWLAIDLDLLQVGPRLSGWHLFGTDLIGRDIFSRTLWALGTSEHVAFAVAVVGTTVGLVTGALAGYYRGWIDAVLMRLADLATAYPALLILFGALIYLRPITPRIVTVVLAAVLWVYPARLVRASVGSQREHEYVEAARALGASDLRILVRHLVPNSLGTVVVAGTALVGQSILLESTVEFFNYGLNQNARPTLGNMIADVLKYGIGGQNQAGLAWWTWFFPALTLVVVLVCVNLIGDGLEATLDPQR
jgi:peptide/nickel transport system permease protein